MTVAAMILTVSGHDFRPDRGRYLFSPAHPLQEQQVYIRENADEVFYVDYNVVGKEIPSDVSGYRIRRSEDGQTSVVEYLSGVIFVSEYTYSTDNKLRVEIMNPQLPVSGYIYYTYDQKGRVETIMSYASPDYQNKVEEVLHIYLDDQTIYTDSGYIHTMIRERQSLYGGIEGSDNIVIKKDTFVTEYVFDKQNRLTREGNHRYTYLESGGIMRTSIYTNEKDRKYESYYDKEGQIRKSVYYIWENDKWEILKYTIISHYKNGQPLATMLVMSDEQLLVYGNRGSIMLTAETEQPVRIYTFNGQLVKQINAVPDQLIPLPRGVYIVVVGSQSCKVVVK